MGARARHALRLPSLIVATAHAQRRSFFVIDVHIRPEHAMKHRPIFRKRHSTRHRVTRTLLLIGAILAALGAGLASVLAR
jgi:hypothetical protein